jgi:hypothetical protein
MGFSSGIGAALGRVDNIASSATPGKTGTVVLCV